MKKNNIRQLIRTFAIGPIAPFASFQRVDTTRYPVSLLKKAYYLYSPAQVCLVRRTSQQVKYSG